MLGEWLLQSSPPGSFNNSGRTGGRNLQISEKALLASMLSPFLDGRKGGNTERSTQYLRVL